MDDHWGAQGGGARAINKHPPTIAGIARPRIKKVYPINCMRDASIANIVALRIVLAS